MAKQKEDPQFSLTKVPHTQLYLCAKCALLHQSLPAGWLPLFTEMLCPCKSSCIK